MTDRGSSPPRSSGGDDVSESPTSPAGTETNDVGRSAQKGLSELAIGQGTVTLRESHPPDTHTFSFGLTPDGNVTETSFAADGSPPRHRSTDRLQ